MLGEHPDLDVAGLRALLTLPQPEENRENQNCFYRFDINSASQNGFGSACWMIYPAPISTIAYIQKS
jgi:hypothetical protein